MKKPDRSYAISLVIILICLIGLIIEFAATKSPSPVYLGSYSTGIFALLLMSIIAAIISSGILTWWLSRPPAKQEQIIDRLRRLLSKQPYQIFSLLILLASLFVLWNFYPYSRISLRLITAVLLILFTQSVLFTQTEVSPSLKTILSNPSTMTWLLGILIGLHLIAGTLLTSTISDEGAQVYTQVQLINGNNVPYAPGGLQMWYAPLTYYIHGAFLGIFGPHLLVARLVSAIAGIACIPLMVSITNHEAQNKFGGALALALFILSFSTLLNFSTAFGYSLTSLFLLLALRTTQITKKGWQRVALGLGFAGLATLVRHTMIIAPFVFFVYFAITEKPRHFLIGVIIAAAVGIAILYPFWPEIITMAWPINRVLDLVYPGVGTHIAEVFPKGQFPGFYKELIHAHTLVSSHLLVFAGAFLASYLLINLLRKRIDVWETLKRNQKLLLIVVLGLSSFIFQFYITLATVCAGCMIIYIDYFIPVLVVALAIIIVRLLPPRYLSLHWIYSGFQAMIVTFVILSSQRAVSLWKYVYPPVVFEAEKVGAKIKSHLDEDDKIFYFGPFHPLISIVDNEVFPEGDYYYYNYLPPSIKMNADAMAVLHKYNDETVDDWLSNKADVVVLTDRGLSTEDDHPSLIMTINSNLDKNFELVEEFSVPDSLPTGDIRLYVRKED